MSESTERKPPPWFKANRTEDARELIRTNPLAYVLAAIVTWRARWSRGFSKDNLQPGEAMLGDFRNYGMTRQEYRTALDQLTKWGFATTRATNHGTVARLTDTRLFDFSPPQVNQQANQQPTIKQPLTRLKPDRNQNKKGGALIW